MSVFFQKIFDRYPVKTRRALEIMPGIVSWTLITFPVWGSLFYPYAVAYFILFFDVYWFYKSFNLAISAFISSKKIKKAEKTDWLENAKQFDNFSKVAHVLVIPNYKEHVYKLRETIQAIADQTFPAKRLYVILAMEDREKDSRLKANELINEFKDIFGGISASYHPDLPGEVKGKSSNQSFAAREAYKNLIEKNVIDINYSTITSVDADSIFDRQYFAYLSYLFLSDKNRYNKFWQSAIVYYNNFWKVPALIRILSFFGGLWRTAVLVQKDRSVLHSTYSLSFVLLKKIDFWDTDVIPEDYRIFFKAFYKLNGNVWVVPLFLKTSMDAPLSSSFIKSLNNKYQQERRWSWGVSDNPLIIKWWFTVKGVPFLRKTVLLYNLLLDHFLWPVNWFIITIAANIMPFVNPVFSRTTLGYNLPRLAGLILSLCLLALVFMIIIDFRQRHKTKDFSKVRQYLFPLEFLLLPIVGFFLSTLPALVSHIQLMRGKRLEYKVTEKL